MNTPASRTSAELLPAWAMKQAIDEEFTRYSVKRDHASERGKASYHQWQFALDLLQNIADRSVALTASAPPAAPAVRIDEYLNGEQRDGVFARAGQIYTEHPPLKNPYVYLTTCNGCGERLLNENIFVDDGCPCNTPRGINFTPIHCDLCKAEDCIKPGHRIVVAFREHLAAIPPREPPAAESDEIENEKWDSGELGRSMEHAAPGPSPVNFPTKGVRQVHQCKCSSQAWHIEPNGQIICAECGTIANNLVATPRAEPQAAMSLIAAERQRQINVEGWTPEHDDEHECGELVRGAAAYLMARSAQDVNNIWPWNWNWWKPTPNNRVRELVKAGALIVAEIERLQRASPPVREGGAG